MSDEFDIKATMRQLYSPWSDPEPGSELAQDDALVPDASVSITAANKLYMALEHLQYFFEAKCDWAVSAPFTVLRTALIGAVHSYWVLVPDDRALRAERALRLAVDDLLTYRTLEKGCFELDDEYATVAPMLLKILDDAEAAMQEAATALGLSGPVAKWRLNNTAIVAAVGEAFITDARAAAAFSLMWRSKSAHAHAALFAQVMAVGPNDMMRTAAGETRVVPRHEPMSYVVSAAMIWHLAQTAFQLYEARRAAPVTAA